MTSPKSVQERCTRAQGHTVQRDQRCMAVGRGGRRAGASRQGQRENITAGDLGFVPLIKVEYARKLPEVLAIVQSNSPELRYLTSVQGGELRGHRKS